MRKIKLLNGLSAVSLAAGALALGACGGEGEGEGEGASAQRAAQTADAGEGASEGEGEAAAVSAGGEGEGGAASDPASDIEYLYRLGLVRGHLAAFAELHSRGVLDMAATHARHPGSEVYASLEPFFSARGQEGFQAELKALADDAFTDGAVEEDYALVKNRISELAPDLGAKDVLIVASKLARIAGDEYSIGVGDNGAIENLHEYQDAFGFLTVAREYVEAIEPKNDAEASARLGALEQLDLALEGFQNIVVETSDLKPQVIYGAAARIEIAALGLD